MLSNCCKLYCAVWTWQRRRKAKRGKFETVCNVKSWTHIPGCAIFSCVSYFINTAVYLIICLFVYLFSLPVWHQVVVKWSRNSCKYEPSVYSVAQLGPSPFHHIKWLTLKDPARQGYHYHLSWNLDCSTNIFFKMQYLYFYMFQYFWILYFTGVYNTKLLKQVTYSHFQERDHGPQLCK